MRSGGRGMWAGKGVASRKHISLRATCMHIVVWVENNNPME